MVLLGNGINLGGVGCVMFFLDVRCLDLFRFRVILIICVDFRFICVMFVWGDDLIVVFFVRELCLCLVRVEDVDIGLEWLFFVGLYFLVSIEGFELFERVFG